VPQTVVHTVLQVQETVVVHPETGQVVPEHELQVFPPQLVTQLVAQVPQVLVHTVLMHVIPPQWVLQVEQVEPVQVAPEQVLPQVLCPQWVLQVEQVVSQVLLGQLSGGPTGVAFFTSAWYIPVGTSPFLR
jgi:hypothetical protein